MNLRTLEEFAQAARRQLHDQVGVRLDYVLRTDSAALRAQQETVDQLQRRLKELGRDALIERVAYTWFNRFCALRFMDVNGYLPVRAVSPTDAFTQPELLQEAKQGQIDPDLPVDRARVVGLLSGSMAAADPQQEAYRLLLTGVCNSLAKPMPFLFEPIADWSELLLPDDLLSTGSVLHAMRAAMTAAACEDEAVLGWLYQFYISEKKDAVYAKMKQGAKVAADELPAVTSLYTPHWIVRFLVENSLGRLWLQNRPQSQLAEHMPYYIAPEEGAPDQKSDCLRVASPEELRMADPACGSGHMLLYAFDLLYRIYEEEGYSPSEIPRLILTKNLYGMEIDPRSAALAAFALTMKARRRDRRFLRRAESAGVRPHICLLHSVHFRDEELAATPWLARLGERVESLPVHDALLADLHAAGLLDDVGSLLRPQLTLEQIEQVREAVAGGQSLFTQELNDRILDALDQLEYLARKYHAVVANPPYFGKGMSDVLKDFVGQEYADVKSDLFAAFILRNTEFAMHGGQLGFMTPFVWMFISSYEKLRRFLIDQKTITNLVQLEYSGFAGATVPICIFTLENAQHPDLKGGYIRLSDFRGAENQGPKTLEAVQNPACGWFYRASAADFNKIPGAPIAYWVSEKIGDSFLQFPAFSDIITFKSGMSTTNNDLFLRLWQEVAHDDCCLHADSDVEAYESKAQWFPYVKGGPFRRWYGNLEYVINWRNDGEDIKKYVVNNPRDPNTTHWSRRIFNTEFFFLELLAWSRISSAKFSVRLYRPGMIFSDASNGGFAESQHLVAALSLLNSKIVSIFLEILSPTLNFYAGDISKVPFQSAENVEYISSKLVSVSQSDWDAYETSWDFTDLPLLRAEHRAATLAATYANLRARWQRMTDEMQRLETENNRLFIDAYGLQDELTPDVPLNEITLTCNPHYRYDAKKSPAELEALLRADTVREFVSYAVGCMVGRYSLDKPGLILANAGETVADYLARVQAGPGNPGQRLKPPPDTENLLKQVGDDDAGGATNRLEPVSRDSDRFQPVADAAALPGISFEPDADNVIPILDGEWFEDDIVARFRRFLRITFGEERFGENLAFIEEALGRDLRSYFLRDFYDDHVRRYQKRPIYWLFSSKHGGRGGAFNALIYLHRYRPDTASTVLEYLRDFQRKLQARRGYLERIEQDPSAAGKEKSAALRERDQLDKALAELRQYERDVLFPLAGEKVVIDLDDGVKVNYNKLGAALKKVTGLTG